VRRLAAILACASIAAACGGEDPGSSPVTDPVPQTTKVVEASAPASAPSSEQLAYREQLVQDIKDGTYVPCTCTAAIRAQDRIDSGKVKAPPRDQLVSTLP
jgi:hypothetical protein